MFVDVPGIVGFAEAVNSSIYWLPEQYPRWGELNVLVPLLGRGRGTGAEPHFHDGHEYWLFLDGLGEAQLGSRLWEVTPNTVVYTPPGVIHRHQMFTPFSVVAAVSRLVGLRRPGHLQLFDGRRGLTVGCEVPSDPDRAPLCSCRRPDRRDRSRRRFCCSRRREHRPLFTRLRRAPLPTTVLRGRCSHGIVSGVRRARVPNRCIRLSHPAA